MKRVSSIPKAQSWSMDIALGIIVFISAFFIIYALLNENPDTKAGSLKEDAAIAAKQIASEETPLGIIDGNEVNVGRLNELKNLSYDELKKKLRIDGDFCLYFEDEKGNIMLINESYKGIGSPKINLSGTPCSQK